LQSPRQNAGIHQHPQFALHGPEGAPGAARDLAHVEGLVGVTEEQRQHLLSCATEEGGAQWLRCPGARLCCSHLRNDRIRFANVAQPCSEGRHRKANAKGGRVWVLTKKGPFHSFALRGVG
jgi:hypothetical protein